MALVPITLPPGVYRNGTDLQSSGRWLDASLVRWTDGTMQPIGGWTARATVTDQPIRGLYAWGDLGGDRRLAAGTFEGLFAVSAAGVTVDITPVGFTVGLASATRNLGFGGGTFGTGLFGAPRPDIGAYSEATTWSLDNWGQNLVACSSTDGDLLEWALNPASDAVAIVGAPTSNSALLVTEERFLFALGAGGNPRKVQWSDREDNTVWTAAATNEAGDIELQSAGKIMLGIRTRGQALILTDIDAHSATYQGPPYVYGFERVGSACGAISRKCAASIDNGVFWMGDRGFFIYSGGAVQQLPCDVIDYVYGNLNAVQKSKVWAVANTKFSEVWWIYPSEGGTECDSYVSFNYKENHWSIGEIARTAGVDGGVFSGPVWAGAGGAIHDHETGVFFDSAVPYAESGPVQIGNGDQVMAATMLIPDERTQGEVTATFKTRFHPNDTERTYGPYSMANPTDVRFTGRQVSMRVQGAAAWRVGVMRVEAKPGGLR